MTRTAALAVVTAATFTSCSLPNRETWVRVKRDGIMKALFSPKSGGLNDSEKQIASNRSGGSFGTANLQSSAQSAPVKKDVPTAQLFAGRNGYVYSPYTTPKKLVSVQGFAAGEQVLCPYTLEPFVVPNYGQARVVVPNMASNSSTYGPEKSSGADLELPRKKPVQLASSNSLDTPEPSNDSDQAVGSWVDGRPGFVYSPYAARHQLVDVTGIAPGVEVKCPYSGRTFRVPEMPSTSGPESAPIPVSNPAPKIEPKPEAPKMDAPKTESPKQEAPKSEPKPEVKVEPKPEAPKPQPQLKAEAKPEVKPQPVQPKPEVKPQPPQPKPATEGMPTAKWIDGKPGLVQSPWGEEGQYVDVTGKAPGTRVLCPFTGKAFLVPAK